MSSVHRRLFLVAAATIAVDLASKAAAVRWLTDPVDLGIMTVRATENSGVAFGIGAGLLVGGGTANLADRLVGGSVVDLFDLGWWPVFNLADVALTVGVTVTLVATLREQPAVTAQPVEEVERA